MLNRHILALVAATSMGAALALGVGLVAGAPDTAIPWSVFGSGGSATSSSTSYQLGSTAGQTAIGPAGSAGFQLGAGFWYGACADPDADGVTSCPPLDNCPNDANAGQQNNDGDALGDACDPDDDNDLVADGADNCQFAANAGQENNDTDVYGDACDGDDDDDGYVDADETLKASDPLANPKTPEHCDGVDEDGDTVVDDEPPGGGYNWDTDGDTVKDCLDASVDTDGDTLVNTVDLDDDGDGFTDVVEVFVSTDSLDRCPDNSSDDTHPLDQDRNGTFNVTDILKYKGKTPASGTTTPKNPVYSRRLDIDGNGTQNVSDILKYKGKTPSACS